MNSLFAVVFDDRAKADAALGDLVKLQGGQVLSLHDAVFVTRTPDGGVKLDQSVNIAAAGALSGAFWGSLVGSSSSRRSSEPRSARQRAA